MIENDIVVCPEVVKKELYKSLKDNKNNDLNKWISSDKCKKVFKKMNDNIIQQTYNPFIRQYYVIDSKEPSGIIATRENDGYIIAFSKHYNLTIVTSEKGGNKQVKNYNKDEIEERIMNASKRGATPFKIPDLCELSNVLVKHIRLDEFLFIMNHDQICSYRDTKQEEVMPNLFFNKNSENNNI